MALLPPRSGRGACRPGPVARQMAGQYTRRTDWVEETIEETLIFYRLLRRNHKHMKSTNVLV